MARKIKTYHLKEDDLEARIRYDNEISEGIANLDFVGHNVRIVLGDGEERVVSNLKLPARYFVRISCSALLGRRMLKDSGLEYGELYEYANGESIWYNKVLLEKLLKDKLENVESVEIEPVT